MTRPIRMPVIARMMRATHSQGRTVFSTVAVGTLVIPKPIRRSDGRMIAPPRVTKPSRWKVWMSGKATLDPLISGAGQTVARLFTHGPRSGKRSEKPIIALPVRLAFRGRVLPEADPRSLPALVLRERLPLQQRRRLRRP